MKEKLVKIVDKIIWFLKLFVSRDVQKKIKLKIPFDRQQHVAVCLVGVIGLSPILMIWFPVWIAIGVAVVSVSLFGIAYEIYQKVSGTGVFDLNDMLADVIGAVAGGVIVGLITFIMLEIFS